MLGRRQHKSEYANGRYGPNFRVGYKFYSLYVSNYLFTVGKQIFHKIITIISAQD